MFTRETVRENLFQCGARNQKVSEHNAYAKRLLEQELRGVDPTTLTRLELRNHLEARDLSTAGNKRQLAERLQASILEEQVKYWGGTGCPYRTVSTLPCLCYTNRKTRCNLSHLKLINTLRLAFTFRSGRGLDRSFVPVRSAARLHFLPVNLKPSGKGTSVQNFLVSLQTIKRDCESRKNVSQAEDRRPDG